MKSRQIWQFAPGDELRDVGRKVRFSCRLASDSRSATYVLFFFRVNFMELKLFGLLSFGFSFGSWFGREMEWENCF